MEKSHYVYVLLDPRRPGDYRYGKYRFKYEPFYVGKGSGNRHDAHWQRFKKAIGKPKKAHRKMNPLKDKRLLKMYIEGVEPIVTIKHRYATSAEAFDKEVKVIETIGRVRYGGPLLNLAAGGICGIRTGCTLTPKQKKRMSKALLKHYATDEGKESAKRMGESQSARLRRERAKRDADPEYDKQVFDKKYAGGLKSWETIKSNPSGLKEFGQKVSAGAKSRYENATPRQRAVWSLQKTLGNLIKKVPVDLRETLKAAVLKAVTKSKSESLEKLKAIMMNVLTPHFIA